MFDAGAPTMMLYVLSLLHAMHRTARSRRGCCVAFTSFEFGAFLALSRRSFYSRHGGYVHVRERKIVRVLTKCYVGTRSQVSPIQNKAIRSTEVEGKAFPHT